ncbi:septum site-determining protein MinC [Filifactor villosus]|uniref:Probable septum site-determining protein MinC n=1 Tax=Filifactor villosus TaxID=29374 RepID=A0ABV9QKK8_9FIRM
MQKPEIEIKGLKGEFIIFFDDQVTLYKAITLLEEKLSSNKDFFKDTVFKEIKAKNLSENDKDIIARFLKEHHDIELPKQTQDTKIEDGVGRKKEIFKEESPSHFSEKGSQQTKFVFETLRSGTLVDFDGHVVVIGDVNPGARVQATGNVIILGNLRGTVHAGANGNKETFVFAERLLPIQLRISNSIAILSEKDKSVEEPLIASIKDDNIVIESCLTRR